MDDLRQKYLEAIAGAADEAALEDLRVAAVGKKGEISLKMRELGKMTPEERQVAGPKLNALKDEINSALAAKKAQGVLLGKPKGTIQSSMYDKDCERIRELLAYGVPQKQIVERHWGYGTTKSLSYYIRTRELRNPAETSKRTVLHR